MTMRQLPPLIRKAYTYLLPQSLRIWLEHKIKGPYPRIYDRRKFIFIHIPKTAGKSIIQLFHTAGACHLTYKEYEEHIGQDISSYYIFTVIRDPLDRLVSLYAYFLNGGNSSRESLEFRKNWITPYKNFNEFVCHALPCDEVKHNRMFLPQAEFLLDKNGELPDISIIRFERLGNDFKKVALKLSINKNLPHTNASNRKNLNLYLSKEACEIIKKTYSEDYKLFDYTPPGMTSD